MPARDHIDKKTGKHMPTLPKAEPHPHIDVEVRPERVVLWSKWGAGQPLTDPQLRWLILELESAWSRVYGEQK
jgi:hypothetical protein